MNLIPSYEKCLEICQSTNNTIFYEQKYVIDGFQVSVFNYRLATFVDFSTWNGFELRGLTFVFNLDGSLYKSYPLLEKFFNLNENESTLFETVKDLKIKSVREKADGSIINFIKLPNGKILAKSKTSFESDQAKIAQELFESNKNINSSVKHFLENDVTPIFELISPRNRIVVNYNSTELILIGLRNQSGEYIDLGGSNLTTCQTYNYNLNEMLELRTKLENTEGWIVEFESGIKIKIKTEWYINLHHILTDYSKREDYLIEMILEEKLDDIISNIEVGSEAYQFIKNIEKITNKKFRNIQMECVNLISTHNGSDKDFAVENLKKTYFPLAVKILKGYDKVEVVKDWIKRKTYRLNEARKWLSE
jgi:T4 RnlA family RNA ligase